MMIEPPIDKLIKKAPCRYALVCAVAKRAKQIVTQEADMLAETKEKPISIACQEIYDGKYVVTKD